MRIALGMSGGVDSTVAACLLRAQGHTVIGVTMQIWDGRFQAQPGSPSGTTAGIPCQSGCYGPGEPQVLAHTVALARRLGLEHHIVPLAAEYRRLVLDYFTAEYLAGRTPNPCVVCNQVIKFDHLLRRADEEGIAFVATGHYAVIRRPENSTAELWRGVDQSKEQSYFLHRLEQRHLLRMVLPLGEMTKKRARQLAAKMKLPTVSEPESQEICFVPGNDYRLFLETSKGMGIAKRGKIVTKEGEKVGDHLGAYRFTIGQRHGLGIASPEPYYVMEIRPEENEVVVGRKENLFSTGVEAASFNWLDGRPRLARRRVLAQIRYRHIPGTGWLEETTPKEVKLEFEEPQWGITPGQALVCYEGERVLGGGWIKKAQGARRTAHG